MGSCFNLTRQDQRGAHHSTASCLLWLRTASIFAYTPLPPSPLVSLYFPLHRFLRESQKWRERFLFYNKISKICIFLIVFHFPSHHRKLLLCAPPCTRQPGMFSFHVLKIDAKRPPHPSIAWHESTYSPPRIAYERLKSGYYTSDRGNSFYHPSAALSASDGATDDSEPKLPTVITVDVAYSCWPRMKWSQSDRRWMPDVPDSTSSVDGSESITDSGKSHIIVPDGGLRAWLVVVGGFIVYFFVFGES